MTAYITHPDCLLHDTGPGHPECSKRLMAISDRLATSRLYDRLTCYEAPTVTREQLLRVHDAEYIDEIAQLIPDTGLRHIDPDTALGKHSLQAAEVAAGAIILATDLVMTGKTNNAFCAVRPPGHHAERDQSMGFCVFNNVAVGAMHALEYYGLDRVAILDFDVHHGNGTEMIFRNEPRVMFCSTFQHPYYPNYPFLENHPNIINSPMPADSTGSVFRHAVNNNWLPALEQFKPQLLLISAGFDAHSADDISGIHLNESDYTWVTRQIAAIADEYAESRIISTLEGGYELNSLASSVEAHLRVMMGDSGIK